MARRSSSAAALQQATALVFLAAVAAAGTALLGEAPLATFDEVYAPLFGDGNLVRSADGRQASITLNRFTGSGFMSTDYYQHGFFSASIKLPGGHTAGVVVAFYLSNGDVFEKSHDELDIEFLGNRRGLQWRIQTNVYGNGSTDRGREERYLLPFDPTLRPHRYSILWTSSSIVFSVDDTPIREVVRTPAMGAEYPAKPMAVYATIWDGSTWATDNGKYKINHKRGPFTALFSDFVVLGCRAASPHARVHPARCAVSEDQIAGYAAMTPARRAAMRQYRQQNMLYTVCYDVQRFGAIIFPECEWDDADQQNFWEWGESRVVKPKIKKRGKSRRARQAVPAATVPPNDVVWRQAAD